MNPKKQRNDPRAPERAREAGMTPRAREAGMTLIEVMIAVLLLAVGVAGMISIQVLAMRDEVIAREDNDASRIARDVIEQIQRMPFDQVPVTVGYAAPAWIDNDGYDDGEIPVQVQTPDGAVMARPDPDVAHPEWCARGHTCGLGEHRAAPVTVDGGSRGVMVLTRVLAADGRQHVEIRTRIVLSASGEVGARRELGAILSALDALLRRLVRP